MIERIGILGSGVVGRTLAKGFADLGYEVQIGNRSGQSIEEWDGKVGTFKEVASTADLIVLAVKGSAAENVVESLKDELAGKTVIDTTNPISDDAPDEGVIHFFTSLEDSLMERLQSVAPEANFVKAFNSVGSPFMVNPKFKDGSPTMFICGNNQDAKKVTADLLKQLGWDSEDFGGAKSARAIEPLCILWCIPGFTRNEWSHAFKLVKP